MDVTKFAGINFKNNSGNAEKHFIIETQSAGGSFADLTGDGRLDIFLTNGVSNDRQDETSGSALFRNEGDGMFINYTDQSHTRIQGWTMGMAIADYDSDGDRDLYVTRWGTDVLLNNNGSGSFNETTKQAGLGSSLWGIGAAFADYDKDGDLDLFVANYIHFEKNGPPFFDKTCKHNGVDAACGPIGAEPEPNLLYQNDGEGRFTEIGHSNSISKRNYYSMGVAWLDYNNDGHQDIYVANDGHPNSLFENNDGVFVDNALIQSVAYSGNGRPQAGMGVAVGDYDNDGFFDLFVTNFAQDNNTLYDNSGKGFFSDVSGKAGLAASSRPFMGWGTFFFDADKDGWEDLFIANGHLMPAIDNAGVSLKYHQRNQLYHNTKNGTFVDISKQLGPGFQSEQVSRGAAFGDYDNDGDLDILISNLDSKPSLLRNETKSNYHWVSIQLRSEGLNTDAIGAKIRVSDGVSSQIREVRTGTSFQAQNDIRQYFGLGTSTKINIEIMWPDGKQSEFKHVGVDRFLTIDHENPSINAE
ncbi:MAG: CRTAC1 family protein [Candidatus Latescibacterota bacterium]|nr:CRTAC1 family protein [Candidatus Latescibacterota bacterium]